VRAGLTPKGRNLCWDVSHMSHQVGSPAMEGFAKGNIECFCGPKDLDAPDDLEAAIVAFIGETSKTLDIAVQELDSFAIAEAVIAKKREGKSVRVLLNRSYLQDDTDAEHRPDPGLTAVPELAADASERKVNRDVFAALCRCGVEVRIDLNPDDRIFHHKFALRDVRLTDDGSIRRGDRPGLLTGSANFTDTDCHKNLNHLFVLRHPDLHADFGEEFREAWAGEFGRGRLGKPPKTHNFAGVPVKVLFAPDHGPESEVIKQMLKCPKGGRIDFAMFTFMGSSAIDDAMIVLAGAERTLRGVLDRQAANMPTAAPKWLREGGVEVLVPRRDSGIRKLHHKLAVVDHSTVIGGSFNYSEPATLYNDEAMLVIGSPHKESEGVEVDAAECAAIADFFRTEIDRIRAVSEPWQS
jgi:phosphatidylserine/phosphatidylglycerophosphate/cardiolipin synthase-like enzyme